MPLLQQLEPVVPDKLHAMLIYFGVVHLWIMFIKYDVYLLSMVLTSCWARQFMCIAVQSCVT